MSRRKGTRKEFDEMLRSASEVQRKRQEWAERHPVHSDAEPPPTMHPRNGMSKMDKLGYGFLLAGIGVPYLIDALLGHIYGFIVGLFFFLGGSWLLYSGQTHDHPHDKRTRRIVATALCAVAVGGSGWRLIHANEPTRLISAGTNVVVNRGEPPFANITVQNIGGDGIIVGHTCTLMVEHDNDEVGEKAVVARRKLESCMAPLIESGVGIRYSVRSQEKKWFTAMGQKLDSTQEQLLTDNKLDFWFYAVVLPEHGPRFYACGHIVGERTGAILECPEP